jgi:IS30 family transposase
LADEEDAQGATGSALYRVVHDHLVHRRWSPERIAQRLRLMEPDDATARVSHETIYAAIHAQPRGGLKAAMVAARYAGGQFHGPG